MKTINVLKVVDLKTGSGVKVYARNNGQLLLYALMARLEWGPIYGPFDLIELHIVQSVLDHIDICSVSSAELDTFEQEVLTILARIKAGDRSAVPGEKQCHFCRAKAECRAHAEYNLAAVKADFAAPETLSISEIAALLPQLRRIILWCNALGEYALAQALTGVAIPGYKLTNGRSNRVWRNEYEAAAALLLSGIPEEKLWNRKIIGITAAEHLLGKSNPVFREQTFKPQGAPTLVPEKDPRPTLEQSIGDDFSAV
jgi:hypothetical protein